MGLLKKFTALTFFSSSILKSFLINTQDCKARSERININKNKLPFYPYSILVNNCSGSCSSINDQYAKLCVIDVKDMSIKVFNLMTWAINELNIYG